MIKYMTKAGERLDQIVWKHYGHLDFFEKVMDENQHLWNKLTLDLGDEVTLPSYPTSEPKTSLKTLWD